MIYFLVTKRNSQPIKNFLRSCGKHFVDRITILYYTNLKVLRNIPEGTFIFSDFDLLTPAQREVVKQIFTQLSERHPHLTLLNDPNKVLLRYDLLKKMYQMGINRFNVERASESFHQLRFPVFVREANRHTGSLTPVIHSAEELHKHLRVLKLLGYDLFDLLIVEYLDVSDDAGVYLKFSAFVLDPRIMPRYLNFSPHWMVKSTIAPNDLLMESKLFDVQKYMKENPHEAWLRKIFLKAGITYGRADYSITNGELQLWEINLNPAFVNPPRNPRKDNIQQRAMRNLFYNQFFLELERIDCTSTGQVRLTISENVLAKMRTPLFIRVKRGFHARLVKKKPHYSIMRRLCYSLVRSWIKLENK